MKNKITIIHTDSLTDRQISDFNHIINQSASYIPYYETKKQPGLFYSLCYCDASPAGFMSALKTDSNVCEITAVIESSFKQRGIFKKMLDDEKAFLSDYGITAFTATLPDYMINSSVNKGLYSTEYLLTYTYSDNSHLLLPDNSSDYEFYFSDDENEYLMYRCSDCDQSDDEPIAVCCLDIQDKLSCIYDVYVDEDIRRQGIGYIFMKNLLKDYHEIYDTPLILHVTSNNTAACKLYKKCGFHEENHIHYYYI